MFQGWGQITQFKPKIVGFWWNFTGYINGRPWGKGDYLPQGLLVMSVQEFVFVCDSSECFLGGARVNVKSHSLLGQKKKKKPWMWSSLNSGQCVYMQVSLLSFPYSKQYSMIIVVNLISQYLSHRISKGNMTQLENESTPPKGTLNPLGERACFRLHKACLVLPFIFIWR